jgi:hypothetical protein
MRKLAYIVVLALVSFACQPKVLILNVQPSSVGAGPASVTINWKISAGSGEMSADQAVTPSLNPPKKVNSQGSMVEQVCKTTTFKLALPYGGERTTTVTVAQPCDACAAQKVLTFTGTCLNSSSGPTYGPQTATGVGLGNLKDLISDADFPVHVLHAGADIALGAGGGPIGPLPAVPSAGDYTIYVPGQVGLKVCQDASGPVGGGQADAPIVHLTVIPNCPP